MDIYSEGYPWIIFSWCLFALSTLFILARLYVQLRFRHRPWREAFLVVAWVLYLTYTICDSLMNDWGWYNIHNTWPDLNLYVSANIASWVASICWKPILYCAKAVLLCFYSDLTPRQYFPKTWWAIMISWGLVVAGIILQLLVVFASCPNLSDNWTLDDKRYMACYFVWKKWNHANWTMNLFTDLLVYILPFAIMRNLPNLSHKEKRAAYWMFGIGTFNIISAISLLGYYCMNVFAGSPVMRRFNIAMNFLIPFQVGSAVIIVCLPYCRRLWHGTRAKDLRPELNTANLAAMQEAVGAPRMDEEQAIPPSSPSKDSCTDVIIEGK